MSSLISSTKDLNLLIIAVFSVAITLGISPVSSVLAVDESGTSEKEIEEDVEGANVSTSESSNVDSVNGPAVASPDDNIIKPINLNKGMTSDQPLQTNNDNQKSAEKIINNNNDSNNNFNSDSANFNNNILDEKKGFNFDKYSSMSELYQSFDLPYTALYKTPK